MSDDFIADLETELMAAATRLAAASARQTARIRLRRVLVPVVGAACIVLAASVTGSPDDPEREAPTRGLTSVGQPVRPPVRAGDPPRGRIELRATDPERGGTLAGLYFTDDGDPCFEVGREAAIREYPVREGGRCYTGGLNRLPPFTYGVGSGPETPTTVDGFARSDVARLIVDGPGGRVDVPRSEHGMWFVAYPHATRATISITAELDDGSIHRKRIEIPVEQREVTERPGRRGDPVLPRLQPRKATVTEIAVRPRAGMPGTTFELAVPPATGRAPYTVSLTGPGGKDCRARLTESFGVLASRRNGRIRPLPPHRQSPFEAIDTPGYDERSRSAPWCRGVYRLTVRPPESQKTRATPVHHYTFQVR